MADVKFDAGSLVAIAIQQAPSLIAMLRGLFMNENPGAEVPTDAEVIAAYHTALSSSLAIDDAIIAAHPDTPEPAPVAEAESLPEPESHARTVVVDGVAVAVDDAADGPSDDEADVAPQ